MRFLLRDRLGSVVTIADDAGVSWETRGYDPFGKPRDGDWAEKTPPIVGSTTTDRGFTDHEHLDDSELIHMNGRAYDYQLGRFLSVDPIIQAVGNSQGLNPYSYIMNNPLSGTDPTGYCIAETGTRVTKCVDVKVTAVNETTGARESETVRYNELNAADAKTKIGNAMERTNGRAGIQQVTSVSRTKTDGSTISTADIGAPSKFSETVRGFSVGPQTEEEFLADYTASLSEHGEVSGRLKVGDDLYFEYSTSGGDGFERMVGRDLRSLRKSEAGLAMLRGIAESGQSVKIFETLLPGAITREGAALWDSTIIGVHGQAYPSPYLFQKANGGVLQPTALQTRYTLAHELVHAWQNTVRHGSPVPRMDRNLQPSGERPFEIQAVRYTNVIRRQQGYPYVRIQYTIGGSIYVDKF